MKMQRWTTRPDANGPPTDDEARAGRLLRHALVRQPLDEATLADLHARLPDERRPAPRRVLLRVGLAITLFLAGGGVVMSATLLGRWSPFRRAAAPQPAAPKDPAPARRRAASPPPPAIIEPAVALAPLVEAVPIAPAALPRRPHGPSVAETQPAPEVAPPAATPPAPSAIAEEAALVGAALRALREGGDASGALALLDARDARFGTTGALADEARTTRVEALLRLGQHAQALVLLDASAPRAAGHGRELVATRGELRADAGRCREAVADFEALLTDDAASDGIAERALYGRAACRARLGEHDAARVDLDAYLSRFPRGRYAARARAAVEQ